ncbi:MAG: hypothetical protein E7621_06015 [Ruminococcaceae bacterium]|nr:hypothetical protein [Oscillospiraceae bacterium]
MKQKIILAVLAAITIFFSASCTDTDTDIINYYKTAFEAAEVCGIETVDFIPAGYEVLSYNSVYGFVFEAEFKPLETPEPAENDMAQIAVLRIADAEYNVTNLSGFADAVSCGIYTHSDGSEFEIKTRNGVYMSEWKQTVGETDCNISYSVFGSELSENEDAFNTYKTMLSELLDYLNK